MRQEQRWAEVDFHIQQINIDKGITPEQYDMRLIHEIIHAILEQNGVTWQNESVIQTIACGLYNTLKENKGMFKAFS